MCVSFCVFDIMLFSFIKTYLVFLSIIHIESNGPKVGFVFTGAPLGYCSGNY